MITSWNGKPYHSLDYMLKERFGEKVYKVTLNGGMSCPNRDGTIGHGGCIFCSEGGSGDFAASAALSIHEQIDSQIAMLSAKRPIHKYSLFSGLHHTYAPVPYLEKIFQELFPIRGCGTFYWYKAGLPGGRCSRTSFPAKTWLNQSG